MRRVRYNINAHNIVINVISPIISRHIIDNDINPAGEAFSAAYNFAFLLYDLFDDAYPGETYDY